MESEFSAWREGAAPRGLRTGRRFTEEMRQAGVALAKRAMARGMSRAEVCRQLGIGEETLRHWEKRKRALVRVEVVAPVEDPVRVRFGRMEAELSVAQMAELARRLW